MSDPENVSEAKGLAAEQPKTHEHSKIGSIAYGSVSYRHWMIGKALEALLMRNGPYKEVAQHAVESVDKVLKILDAEPVSGGGERSH